MFSAIGNFVASVASTVADAVETAVDAVVDTVADVVNTVADVVQDGVKTAEEWTCKNTGDVGCAIGNVVLGFIDGFIEGLQDVIVDVLVLEKDFVRIFSSLLRLDFSGFLSSLVDFAIGFAHLLVDVGRAITFGYIAGGILGAFQRDALRDFVERLVNERYDGDEERLRQVRRAIGLDGARFGFPMRATHRVFRLDSANVPLWDWHNRGVINLFLMADLGRGFDMRRPRTIVTRVVGSGRDVRFINRSQLWTYITSEGRSGRIRVYAISRAAIADNLRVAAQKCEQLGVFLSWNDGATFSWFRHYTTHDITTEEEYTLLLDAARPSTPGVEEYLVEKGLRSGGRDEECSLLALAAFHFVPRADGPGLPPREVFGQVAGRVPLEGESAVAGCRVPGRTDLCCNTVRYPPSEDPRWRSRAVWGSGVLYRDAWPHYVFRYVLAHEIGHYLGLCHITHEGFQDIMFSAAFNSVLSWNLFNYYLQSEPRFSLRDGMNAWRFLVNELEGCFPGPTPPPDPIG